MVKIWKKQRNISLLYISIYIAIVFSGYFVNVLPLQPVYIPFVLGTVGAMVAFWKQRIVVVDKATACSIFFIIYIVISQILLMANLEHALFNVLTSLVYYCLALIGLRYLSYDNVLSISISFINVSLILLIIEGVYRITHPILTEADRLSGVHGYYQYKYNSIMFTDSNFVGIFLLSLFFLCSYLTKYHNCKLKIQKVILAILVLGTVSKAAIASFLLFFIIFELNLKVWKKIVFLGVSAAVFLPAYLIQIVTDGSLGGKFAIFTNTLEYLKNVSVWRLLFGVGFGKTREVFTGTLAGHNLLITYIVEAGVIGVLLLLILWWITLKESKWKAAIVMAPVFLDGMSLIGHAIPFVYCAYAIIIVLNRKVHIKVYEKQGLAKEKYCS